jgi:hypothetical protein
MSSIDLAAVCARHGIRVAKNEYGRWIGWGWGLSCLYDYATEADAICALLKARHGVVTWEGIHPFRTGPTWWAKSDSERHPLGFEIEWAGTELAAVVALADRMPAVCS